MARRSQTEDRFDAELADMPPEMRWREWMGRVEAVIFASPEPVGRETLARVDRAEMGLRERPIDADIGRLVQAVEGHNRDLHARVDRLEMGLREGLVGYEPAPTTVRPAALSSQAYPPAASAEDPVGSAVPR